MKRYEYKTISSDAKGLWGGKVDLTAFDRMLNDMGAQGWEYMTSIPSNETYGSTRYVLSIFKRDVEGDLR